MFWSNFERYCTSTGKSPTAVLSDLSIPISSGTYWRQGHKPNNKTLARLAEYFGCYPADLLENSTSPPSAESGSVPADFISAYLSLSDADRQSVDQYARFLLSQAKNRAAAAVPPESALDKS